jgi:sugar O-acyltransferase (sialic acid O-acetyltransferase NeuD family)
MVALILFPHCGNTLEALDCLGERYSLLGFIDDAPGRQGVDIHGHPVFSREALLTFPDARVLAAPGSPESFLARRKIIDSLGLGMDRFATVVHPSARVSRLATIGHNVLIMAGAVITSNARIGNHVCVLPNSVIHHDAIVGDWSLIGSNVTLAGGVVIGENCYVASGTNVTNGARIGDRTLLGLGANVITSFPSEVCVAGNPARVLASNMSGPEKSCK